MKEITIIQEKQSGTVQHTDPQEPPSDKNQWYAEQKRNWERQLRPQWAIAVATIAAIGVGWYSVKILRDTLNATNMGLKQSREFFDATQRALVMLGNKDGKLAEFRQGNKPIIVLHFYNAGPTPAVDFAVQVSSSLGPSSVTEPQLNRYWSSSSGRVKLAGQPTVAIAGHSGHIKYLTDPLAPSKEQLAEIKNGTPFFVTGIYIYCDRFGLYSAEYFNIAYVPRVDDFVVNINYPFPIDQMSKPPSPTMEQGATITRLLRCKQPGEDEELKKKEPNRPV